MVRSIACSTCPRVGILDVVRQVVVTNRYAPKGARSEWNGRPEGVVAQYGGALIRHPDRKFVVVPLPQSVMVALPYPADSQVQQGVRVRQLGGRGQEQRPCHPGGREIVDSQCVPR